MIMLLYHDPPSATWKWNYGAHLPTLPYPYSSRNIEKMRSLVMGTIMIDHTTGVTIDHDLIEGTL